MSESREIILGAQEGFEVVGVANHARAVAVEQEGVARAIRLVDELDHHVSRPERRLPFDALTPRCQCISLPPLRSSPSAHGLCALSHEREDGAERIILIRGGMWVVGACAMPVELLAEASQLSREQGVPAKVPCLRCVVHG